MNVNYLSDEHLKHSDFIYTSELFPYISIQQTLRPDNLKSRVAGQLVFVLFCWWHFSKWTETVEQNTQNSDRFFNLTSLLVLIPPPLKEYFLFPFTVLGQADFPCVFMTLYCRNSVSTRIHALFSRPKRLVSAWQLRALQNWELHFLFLSEKGGSC